MCEPIDVLFIEKNGPVLLNTLVVELHKTWGELISAPKFVDNPNGNNLNDIVANVDHAIEHIHNALSIIRILHEGGFINKEGR